MKNNGQCYECQYKARKKEIGPNMKAYESALTGITGSLKPCDTCGELGITYKYDMDRAIKASHNTYINPEEWD